jgi:uncharacterized protein (DUF4415 family)
MRGKSTKLNIHMPGREEDRRINKGIAADPDTWELSAAEFRQLRPVRGRPKLAVPKVPINLRIDAEVLRAFRATGSGWQTRMNAVLRSHVAVLARAGKRGATRSPAS